MGVRISQLPVIAVPALTDVFPVVQAGVTYQESMTQLSSLFALAINGTLTNPTLITPTLGVAAATSLQFIPSTGGIIGTVAADNAGAGKVGEFISSVIASGASISLTTVTAANVTSISLTAGDWDVWGNISFSFSPTSSLICDAWSSSTSATLPDLSLYNSIDTPPVAGFTGIENMSIPYHRYSISTTTIIYLSALASFSGTCTACGAIYARRAR